VADAVADHTAGSPVDANILWTNRSPSQIADEVASQGFTACADTIREILTEELQLGFRQAEKEESTRQFPERNEQFEHIARLRHDFEREGCPIISIDTKKKELLGDFFRPGQAYTNGAVRVLDHDFATLGHGRLVPYGVYDVTRNEGLVLLSVGPDTNRLACDAIRSWWQSLGRRLYEGAERMLVLCDCGGSNGYRQNLFKEELHFLAGDLGLPIRVAHYPPGCSKYNPIERRMFCHVTRALRGVVLRSVEVARQFIARTTTSTGLEVIARVATALYTKGLKASPEFLAAMPVRHCSYIPQLNYTVYPAADLKGR
jgi:hypothetical protein